MPKNVKDDKERGGSPICICIGILQTILIVSKRLRFVHS